jgi:hypothetical protein
VGLGFLGIMAGLMVWATVVGIKVLRSGVSEISISTLIKGSAYLSLFLLVSAYAVSYLVAIPILWVAHVFCFDWCLLFGDDWYFGLCWWWC